MPQLDLSFYLSQMFWFLLTFSGFFILVAKVVYPKIDTVVTYRREAMKNNLSESRRILEEVDNILELKEKDRVSTSLMLANIVAETKKSINKIKEEIEGRMQSEIATMMIEERSKIKELITAKSSGLRADLFVLADKLHVFLLGTEDSKPSSIVGIQETLDLL